jgi:hypothetical protein
MTAPKIETPRGKVFQTPNGKAELVWNTNFVPIRQKNYSDAQKFIDSEVLRLSEPFTPLLTSMLIKSGILGTDIGSGTVKWIAPYAKAQYYKGRQPGRSKTGPLRGAFWFERGKEIWGQKLIRSARKMAGSGK